jgi:hypothetical protein
MTHLMLTSALLFALLAVVAIAIGASLGIARDLMLDEPGVTATDIQAAPTREGLAVGEGYATRQGHGLAEDFGLGLQHATHFAQDPGRSFSRHRSFSPRV